MNSNKATRGRKSVLTTFVIRLKSILNALSEKGRKREIIKSGAFNKDFYLQMYYDVKLSKMDPIDHFLQHGWREGKYPSSDFSPAFYLNRNPDVRQSGLNPFIHYLRYGRSEKRAGISKEEKAEITNICRLLESGLWDADYYLKTNDDVSKSGANPLKHFLESGGSEGRNPSPHFDSDFYLEEYPDARKSGCNPLMHYILVGKEKGNCCLPSQLDGNSDSANKLSGFKFYIDEIKRLSHKGQELGLLLITGWCYSNNKHFFPEISVFVDNKWVDKIIPEFIREDVVRKYGESHFPNGFSKVIPISDHGNKLSIVEQKTDTVLISETIIDLKKNSAHELDDHEFGGYLAYSSLPDWIIGSIKEHSQEVNINPIRNYYRSVFIPMLNLLAKPDQQIDGYNLIGFFSKITGISEVARAFVNSLQKKNEAFVLVDYFQPLHRRISDEEEKQFYEFYNKPLVYDKNVFLIDWRMLRQVKEDIPLIFENKRNIVAFWWEFETGFEDNIEILNEIDEVYVFSDFIQDILSKIPDRKFKITKIKYPFYKNWEILEQPDAIRIKYGLSGKFCFFFNFHYASGFRRKNPTAILQALSEEFSQEEEVFFFVKTNHVKGFDKDEQNFHNKVKELGLEKRVIFHEDSLSRDGFMTLLNAMDCYISLHRGEGLGLGILEALALEKPVIASNYGGNTEYMDHPLAFPVAYKLIPTDDDFVVYQKVKEWAEPDILEARKLMRKIYNQWRDKIANKV